MRCAKPITPSGVDQIVRNRAREAGIRNVHPHQVRIVELGSIGLSALRQQHAQQAAYCRLLGDDYGDRDLVLADSMGRPLQVSTLYRWVEAALRRAGLPTSTRLHDLRQQLAR